MPDLLIPVSFIRGKRSEASRPRAAGVPVIQHDLARGLVDNEVAAYPLQPLRSGLVLRLANQAPGRRPLHHQPLDHLLVVQERRQRHDAQHDCRCLENLPAGHPLLEVLRTGQLSHQKGSTPYRGTHPKILLLQRPPPKKGPRLRNQHREPALAEPHVCVAGPAAPLSDLLLLLEVFPCPGCSAASKIAPSDHQGEEAPIHLSDPD